MNNEEQDDEDEDDADNQEEEDEDNWGEKQRQWGKQVTARGYMKKEMNDEEQQTLITEERWMSDERTMNEQTI